MHSICAVVLPVSALGFRWQRGPLPDKALGFGVGSGCFEQLQIGDKSELFTNFSD